MVFPIGLNRTLWYTCHDENSTTGHIRLDIRTRSLRVEIDGSPSNLAWDGKEHIYWTMHNPTWAIPNALYRTKLAYQGFQEPAAEKVGDLSSIGSSEMVWTIRIMSDGYLYGSLRNHQNGSCILKWSLPTLELQQGGVRNKSICAPYVALAISFTHYIGPAGSRTN
jgi:hypothetical protein